MPVKIARVDKMPARFGRGGQNAGIIILVYKNLK